MSGFNAAIGERTPVKLCQTTNTHDLHLLLGMYLKNSLTGDVKETCGSENLRTSWRTGQQLEQCTRCVGNTDGA